LRKDGGPVLRAAFFVRGGCRRGVHVRSSTPRIFVFVDDRTALRLLVILTGANLMLCRLAVAFAAVLLFAAPGKAESLLFNYFSLLSARDAYNSRGAPLNAVK